MKIENTEISEHGLTTLQLQDHVCSVKAKAS